MFKKMFMSVAMASALMGCATVTIQPVGIPKRAAEPTLQETKNFFIFGLVGEQHVDVQSVCGTKKVAQMQSQASFVNILVSIVTIGIYTPHSVKIWCE